MRVAIHQPNFMPWLGFFHRLAMVDRFVVFDHVQAMGGRTWLSRNRLLIAGEGRWFSLPVKKAGRLGQAVKEVEVGYEGDIARKHLRTIEVSYGRCAHAEPFIAMMNELYQARYRYIAELNTAFIRAVCRHLGVTTEFIWSTDVVAKDPAIANLGGNELVLAVCRAAGATDYVSGDGCLDFIRPEAFEAAGIAFYFQKFVHPTYRQHGAREFVSHLSVFDALCNLGAAATRELIAIPALTRPVAAGAVSA